MTRWKFPSKRKSRSRPAADELNAVRPLSGIMLNAYRRPMRTLQRFYPSLFVERLNVGEDTPQSLVAAVAACVVCFGDKSSGDYSWALGVLADVEGMREPTGVFNGSKIHWHPAHQLIYALLHPNQALLQTLAGHCLPIASSLEQPLRDAEINNVGIWFAGNDFYSEMEAHAISAVLETAGITSAIVSGRGKTKDEFLDFYNHADFDLIWIAGHGICDRWDPQSPAILAGDAGEIEMDLLVPRLTRPSRRLLVLNICDGGTSTLTGGIQKLGLAPMLASQHQATLSHLWPVEPRVAAAFGVLLATELAQSRDDFFGAFKAAIRAFREPWAAIVERIAKQYEGDLVDRLRNCEHDMRNIFHWGSPCFFE